MPATVAESTRNAARANQRGHQRTFPAVVASELRSNLLDYLRTTFKLQDAALERALFEFLQDPEQGLFRGPYLDVRLPFVKAPEGWRAQVPLDYVPPFRPYAHQLQAFERLGSLGQLPRATLITTGTGSGKTECFLYPLLDHCRRARQRGERGIKAIVLYPMNALASDQAGRFASELSNGALSGVSAGLYVGGKGHQAVTSPDALIDDRDVLRQSPPDILLTNYKMLDLLLMRPADAPLWKGARLQYLVLDELHSYDGAQGSDVACLIRRLKARLGMERGQLCPVGTSATLGGSGTDNPGTRLAEFASQVFGEDFDASAIIEESRSDRASLVAERTGDADGQRTDEGSSEDDPSLPFERLTELCRQGQANPTDAALYATPRAYLDAQAVLWGGLAVRMPIVLGSDLRDHRFLSSLLRALTAQGRRQGPVPWAEVIAGLSEEYKELAALPPDWQWGVLASFLSLVSQARSVEGDKEQYFLHVEVQLWVRELRGLLRKVHPTEQQFAWADELVSGNPDEHWSPLVYCRDCGTDAWAATQRLAESSLRMLPGEVGRAFFDKDPSARVIRRASLAALEAALVDRPDTQDGAEPSRQRLCSRCLQLFGNSSCSCGASSDDALIVQVYEASPQWPLFKCPSCLGRNSLTWLGARASTLCSVTLSRWYASEFNPEPKLLAFTDSVQDASHHAGFFGGRAHRFSLRTALQSALEPTASGRTNGKAGAMPAPEMARAVRDHWVAKLGPRQAVAALLPPDLSEDREIRLGLQNAKQNKVPEDVWAALEERLGFDALFEFSLGVNQGRSLEATGCSTLAVEHGRLSLAAHAFAEVLREHAPVPDSQVLELDALAWRYLDGLTQRLRQHCGVLHPWLLRYAETGETFFLSRRRNPRISHFGPGNALPVFWHVGTQHQTHDAVLASTATWYQDFFQRLFRVPRNTATGVALARHAVNCLTQAGILGSVPKADSTRGLLLEALELSPDPRRLVCSECQRKRHVPLALLRWVEGTCCDRFRCGGVYRTVLEALGTYTAGPYAAPSLAPNYYQRLYKSGRLASIFAEEHTGLLSRGVRELLERRFKSGDEPGAPNLLACTPTLEMGIDIGDLGNVMLCSVPPRPSNYLQRIGRAGRKSGNALVITWANQRPHDLYFFAQPEEMLRGQVAPPGCFLDAPEMLARQMLAHGLDHWAMVAAADALPHQMRLVKLDKLGSFPQDFVDFYRRNQQSLTDDFLELFAAEMSPANATRLRANAGTVLTRALDALQAAKDDAKHYGQQIERLDKQLQALIDDPEKAPVAHPASETLSEAVEREKRELAEMKSAYARLRKATSERYPLNVLTDAGVLPNYAFPEPGVILNALLRDGRPPGNDTGSDTANDNAASKGRKSRGERVEYMRAASQALREFAPFNTFYAEGHKIKVSQLDLGTKGDALEAWVLCSSCHHAERVLDDAPAAAACPECGDPRWADAGQRFTLLQFRRALSVVNRAEAAARDDNDEREMSRYRIEQFIDVRSEHYQGAWLIESDRLVFGYELLRDLELREMNFGPRFDGGSQSQIGGVQIKQQGFLTCVRCGKVALKEGDLEHAPTCGVRTHNWSPKLGRVILYRSVRSEAIRVLLPVSDQEVERVSHTLRAALHLGFRKKFHGQPLHLQISTADEYRNGKKRRFLIIYDTVPGGTGYLAELWKTDGFMDVLGRALRALQTCSYCLTHGRDGCYRCIFAYQEARYLPHISRQKGIEILARVLGAQGALVQSETLSDARMDQVLESELEERFVAALEAESKQHGWHWQSVPRGGKRCYTLDTPKASWLIEPQRRLGPLDGVALECRPDFIATCTAPNGVLPVAIFCDGLEYHVCPSAEESRLGDDLHKRQAILDSDGFHVWSITWKDLDAALGGSKGGPTTLFAGINTRQLDQALEGEALPVPVDLRHQNNFGLLAAFLAEPSAPTWSRLATALGLGMLRLTPKPLSQATIERQRRRLRTRDKLSDWPLSDAPGIEQGLAGYEQRTHAGLLTEISTQALGGTTLETGGFAWTLRLFDAPADRRSATFEESWRAVLHAWNLLQFNRPLPEVLSGESIAQQGAELQQASTPPAGVADPSIAPKPGRRTATPQPSASLSGAERARFVKEYPEFTELAGMLLAEQLPLPLDFGDLTEELPVELDALLCWPQHGLALCADLMDRDAEAWRAHGWTAFDASTEPHRVIAALRATLPRPTPRRAQPRK